MNGGTCWLSRISPEREAFEHKDWVGIGGLDPYGQHKLLWTLFDLPRTSSPEQTAFLFRSELKDGLPLFYVLSHVVPHDTSGKWRIDPREYRPDLRAGDQLTFKLRANPVSLAKNDRTPDEAEIWTKKRERNGFVIKDVSRKRIRHDVVMHAKQRMGWKDLPPDERPSLAHVAYDAGAGWLREREPRLGCQFAPNSLRVDGHFVHCLKGRRNEKGNCRGITLSTLDFEGELSVTKPETFLSALLTGIGPAKAFGCGLMLVRRA